MLQAVCVSLTHSHTPSSRRASRCDTCITFPVSCVSCFQKKSIESFTDRVWVSTELSALPPSRESLRRLPWCTCASARQSRAQGPRELCVKFFLCSSQRAAAPQEVSQRSSSTCACTCEDLARGDLKVLTEAHSGEDPKQHHPYIGCAKGVLSSRWGDYHAQGPVLSLVRTACGGIQSSR